MRLDPFFKAASWQHGEEVKKLNFSDAEVARLLEQISLYIFVESCVGLKKKILYVNLPAFDASKHIRTSLQSKQIQFVCISLSLNWTLDLNLICELACLRCKHTH